MGPPRWAGGGDAAPAVLEIIVTLSRATSPLSVKDHEVTPLVADMSWHAPAPRPAREAARG
jgi:hypothetical protein